jgi:hypothetical protein
MTSLSTFPRAVFAFKVFVLSFGLVCAACTFAQSAEVEQLALAREAVAKQDWRTAEALLVPLSQKQSQAQNPFVFYELAQVYENTRRPDAAKKIYQELTTSPDLALRQPTIVVRAPYASRLLSLISLSQSKLNAIEARQMAALPPPEAPPPKPAPAVIVPISPPATNLPAITAATIPIPATQSQESLTAAAVSVALRNWADAWAKKDLPKYYASYVDNYRGDFQTAELWKRQRLNNISKAKTIVLDIRDVAMTTASPTTVQVRFQQIYTSDILRSTSAKTLTFALKNGRWLIENEASK